MSYPKYYNMSYPKRGFHLIFAHEFYDNDIEGMKDVETRLGTEADIRALVAAYSHLGFTNIVFKDKSVAAIKLILDYYANYNHDDHDCLAVTVMTHGNEKHELYARDASFPLDEMWMPFQADRCPSLAGKPKLFVFQACKGRKKNPGVELITDDTNRVIIPTQDDFSLVFSTWQGDVSYRNIVTGAIYIQSLCSVILEDVENDWATILELAKIRTTQEFNKYWPNCTQCPNSLTSLNGKVMFRNKKTQISSSASGSILSQEDEKGFILAFGRCRLDSFQKTFPPKPEKVNNKEGRRNNTWV
jgi:caspase-like apoptosis-related cysteine protease